MLTPDVVRLTRRGVPGWLHTVTGRWFPLIAGAAEDPPKDPPKDPPADPPKDPPADPPADPPKDPPTQADIDKAYEKLRVAEEAAKKGKAAEKRLAELEAANLSETERLKKQATEGQEAATKAVETLRKANLRLALASTKGLADPRMAAGLISGVEYDDEGEPTNLDDRVKALIAEYPLLKGEPGKPKPPEVNGGGGGGGEKPDLTAAELEAAKGTGMTAARYAAMKNVKSLEDFQKLQEASKAK